MTRPKLFLLVLCLASLSSIATTSHAQARPPVHYFRQRGVRRVRAMHMSAPDSGLAEQSMKVDLFPDVSVRIRLNHVERAKDGAAWFGGVDGAPYGSATFVQTGNSLIGAITRGDGKMYQVRTEPDGTQWS